MAKRGVRTQKHFILQDGRPVQEASLSDWFGWLGKTEKERLVGRTKLEDIEIVTQFIGLEAAKSPYGGPAKLYQTMVNGGKPNGMMRVYETAAEAETGHGQMVAMVRKYFSDPEEEK